MKLTEDQNYNEITVQSDTMSDIVQKLNELSKLLSTLHKRVSSYECDEDEDEDEDDEDEYEDDEYGLDW